MSEDALTMSIEAWIIFDVKLFLQGIEKGGA
jgi:hypothetical protein